MEQRQEGHIYKPKDPGSPRKAGGSRKESFPTTFRGSLALLHLDFTLLTAGTEREYIFVVLSYLVCSNLRQQPKEVRQNPRPILSLLMASSLPSLALITSTPATLVPLLLLSHASAQPPLQVLFLLPGMPFPKAFRAEGIGFPSFPLVFAQIHLLSEAFRISHSYLKRRWSVPASNLLLYSTFYMSPSLSKTL